MPFQSVKPSRLYRQVAAQIAGMIAAGELAAGCRLPSERDLSAKLAVSRPTVREAMIALEIEGLVEVRTGSGVYVADDIAGRSFGLEKSCNAGASPLEVIDARLTVECALMAEAARRIDRPQLVALQETIERMATARSRKDYQDADRDFHTQIAAAAGNSVLQSIVEGLWQEMRSPIFERLSWISGLTAEHEPPTITEHRRVLQALTARSPEQAVAAMRAHLGNVRAYLQRDWRDGELPGAAEEEATEAAE